MLIIIIIIVFLNYVQLRVCYPKKCILADRLMSFYEISNVLLPRVPKYETHFGE